MGSTVWHVIAKTFLGVLWKRNAVRFKTLLFLSSLHAIGNPSSIYKFLQGFLERVCNLHSRPEGCSNGLENKNKKQS